MMVGELTLASRKSEATLCSFRGLPIHVSLVTGHKITCLLGRCCLSTLHREANMHVLKLLPRVKRKGDLSLAMLS